MLAATQEDGTPVMVVFTAPLTPEALAGQGPAVVDLDEKDITAYLTGLGSLLGGGALEQPEPQVVAGPGFVRNSMASLLAGARTSVALQGDALSDPGVIAQLGGLTAKGVDVRVTLARGREADRDALVAAGVADVRIAAAAHLAHLILVDGRKAWLGSTRIAPDALDQHRALNVLLEQPDVWPGASALLDATWEGAR